MFKMFILGLALVLSVATVTTATAVAMFMHVTCSFNTAATVTALVGAASMAGASVVAPMFDVEEFDPPPVQVPIPEPMQYFIQESSAPVAAPPVQVPVPIQAPPPPVPIPEQVQVLVPDQVQVPQLDTGTVTYTGWPNTGVDDQTGPVTLFTLLKPRLPEAQQEYLCFIQALKNQFGVYTFHVFTSKPDKNGYYVKHKAYSQDPSWPINEDKYDLHLEYQSNIRCPTCDEFCMYEAYYTQTVQDRGRFIFPATYRCAKCNMRWMKWWITNHKAAILPWNIACIVPE